MTARSVAYGRSRARTAPARRSRLGQAVSTLCLIALAAAWIALAPTRLGGQVSYIFIVGNSMEPLFHRGDLAIVREADDYEAGDIVTYRHPDIGPVIHRILRPHGDRFVLKGDNNNFLDGYEPTKADIIGKLWFWIPGAGGILEQLRTPWIFAGAAGMLAMVAFYLVLGGERGGSSSGGGQPPSPRRSMNAAVELRQGLLTACGVLAIASLALFVFAQRQPPNRAVPEEITYAQSGAFSYTAEAPEDGPYDSTTIETGDPVFLRVIDAVDVTFTYQFTSELPHDVSGTYRLTAQLSDPSGWKRTLELAPTTPFRGDSFEATGLLDLNAVQIIVADLREQTGVQRNDYTLTVVPDVTIIGAVAGRPLGEQFRPALAFKVDPLTLQVAPGGSSLADMLSPSRSGSLNGFRTEPNSLSLLALRMDVGLARVVGVVGLIVAFLGMLAAAVLSGMAARAGEAAQIQSKYSAYLVNVLGDQLPAGSSVVDVAEFDELVRLADRTGRMILHGVRGDAHEYLLQDGEVGYRYRALSGAATQPAGAPVEAAEP